MPTRQLSWLLVLCAVAPGCSIVSETTKNLFTRPAAYSFYKDNVETDKHARELARQAWLDVAVGSDPAAYSVDYADGFQSGFAEFLDFGGTGSPPPVPPREYWKIKYQTPTGHQAIQDWYAGYAQGSSAAQASGLRSQFVVPVSEPYCADRVALLRQRSRMAYPWPAAPPAQLPPAEPAPMPSPKPAAPQAPLDPPIKRTSDTIP